MGNSAVKSGWDSAWIADHSPYPIYGIENHAAISLIYRNRDEDNILSHKFLG